jgi:lysozyme family protein
MANIIPALEKTLKWEGGYTVDTGGKTKFGISQKAYPDLDIPNLTIEQAREIYRRDYWNRIQGDFIKSQKTAGALFDYAVNAGVSKALKAAQTVLKRRGFPIAVDGKIGASTLAAINATGDILGDLITQERISFYEELVKQNPAKYGTYLKGWLKRAHSFFSSDRAAAASRSILKNPLAWGAAAVLVWWLTKYKAQS